MKEKDKEDISQEDYRRLMEEYTAGIENYASANKLPSAGGEKKRPPAPVSKSAKEIEQKTADVRIDLHGKSIQQVQNVFDGWLKHRKYRGYEKVTYLIITGKGNNSEYEGVLKNYVEYYFLKVPGAKLEKIWDAKKEYGSFHLTLSSI